MTICNRFKLFIALTTLLGLVSCTENSAPKDQPYSKNTENPGISSTVTGSGKVKFQYESTSKFKIIEKNLRDAKSLEWLADAYNKVYRLNTDLLVKTSECGFINAFYDPNKKSVTLCYELLKEIFDDSEKEYENGTDVDSAERYFDGNFWFILFHELGHAFVDIMDLPITGKEEDFSDQFGIHSLIDLGLEKDLPLVAYRFIRESQKDTKPVYWDNHSVDEQRYFNILCWVYGYDQKKFKYLITEKYLPKERAEYCPSEYKKLNTSILVLTAKHTDPKLLEAICEKESKAGEVPAYCK